MNATWCEECAAMHLPEVAHVPPTGQVATPSGSVALVDYAVHAFKSATERVVKAQAEETRAADDRVAALKALRERVGLSCPEIGKLVGLSGARVNQLLHREPPKTPLPRRSPIRDLLDGDDDE